MLAPDDRLLAEMLVLRRWVTTKTIARAIQRISSRGGTSLAAELLRRRAVSKQTLELALAGVRKHGTFCFVCDRPFIRQEAGQNMCRKCRKTKSSAFLRPWDTAAELKIPVEIEDSDEEDDDEIDAEELRLIPQEEASPPLLRAPIAQPKASPERPRGAESTRPNLETHSSSSSSSGPIRVPRRTDGFSTKMAASTSPPEKEPRSSSEKKRPGTRDPLDETDPVAEPVRFEPKVQTVHDIESFGSYEILSELGRGAMGVVFKAKHKTLSRLVALKVLSAGENASPRQIQRFRRETEALARLKHPNIVSIYEVGVEKGYPFYTMDMVEGKSLEWYLANREIDTDTLVDVLEQVAVGIDYVHAHGFIHRDLKPANVLMDEGGRARITDFGLAANQFSSLQLTLSGMSVGTPLYMSPEQSRAERERTDGRADVWALGVILYRFLANRLPFTGKTPLDIYEQINKVDPPMPREIDPNIHQDLEAICMKCLQKDPEDRYLRARLLAEDLRLFRKGLPVRQARQGFTPLRRALWAVFIVALLLIVVTVLLVAYSGDRTGVVSDTSSLQSDGDGAETDPLTMVMEALTSGDLDEALISLDRAKRNLKTSSQEGSFANLTLLAAESLLQRGRAQDRQTALMLLQEVHARSPANRRALRELARISPVDEAEKYWQKILDGDAEDREALLALASYNVSRQSWELAEAQLQTLLSLGGDADAYELRARMNLQLGRPDEAESDYSVALSHETDRASALLGRGKARVLAGRVALAELDFAAAAAYAPTREPAILAWAALLQSHGRYTEAAEVCRKYAEVVKSPDVAAILAESLLQLGLADEAGRVAESAVSAAGESSGVGARLQSLRARSLHARGLLKPAQKALASLLEAEFSVDAALQFAMTALDPFEVKFNEPEDLRRILERAASTAKERAEPRLLLALLDMKEEKLDAAKLRVQEAQARAPESVLAWELAGRVEARSGQGGEASFRKAVRLWEKESEQLRGPDMLARRWLALGEAGETAALYRARAFLSSQLHLTYQAYPPHLLYGQVLASIGDWDAALSYLEKVALMNPLAASTQMERARIYLNSAEPDSAYAAELMNRAIEIEPGELEWMIELARLEQAMGNHGVAISWLEKHRVYKPLDDAALQLLGQCAAALQNEGLIAECQTELASREARKKAARGHMKEARQQARDRNLQEAVLQYQTSLQLDNGLAEAALELASVLIEQGQLESALSSLARSVQLDPGGYDRAVKVLVHELSGEERLRLWRKYYLGDTQIHVAPERKDAILAILGTLQEESETGSLEAGREAVERWIDRSPTSPVPHLLRAWYRARLGTIEAAIDDYQLASRLDSTLHEPLFGLAIARAREHNPGRALTALRRAVDHGFADPSRTEKDASFAEISKMKAFRDIVASMGAERN